MVILQTSHGLRVTDVVTVVPRFGRSPPGLIKNAASETLLESHLGGNSKFELCSQSTQLLVEIEVLLLYLRPSSPHNAYVPPLGSPLSPARAVIYDPVLLRYLHKTRLQYCMASQLRSTSWVPESPNVGS